MKFTVSAAALCLVGFFFMDTPQRKNNRVQDRMNFAQMDEAFFLYNALNSPLPWERN